MSYTWLIVFVLMYNLLWWKWEVDHIYDVHFLTHFHWSYSLSSLLKCRSESEEGEKKRQLKRRNVVNSSECPFDHSACSFEMQFASFSPSVKKTCLLAKEMRKAQCHTACSWLSEECKPAVGRHGGGSCLPTIYGTKVLSRCSGI